MLPAASDLELMNLLLFEAALNTQFLGGLFSQVKFVNILNKGLHQVVMLAKIFRLRYWVLLLF